ncbi:MAG: TetR/AcrR family transcriptional regulator [Xanthobacteraceae bacterium]|nr:TetR/AcrR family transcriptional regulator [Xanthobacteraceae bacterium]
MAKTPRKPRSDKKAMAAETRSAILRAAQALFAAKGFFDTTIADIVKAAGVSRGTFYLYFKDREDVFATLLSQAVDEMFLLSASRQTGSRQERIESANRAYLETFRRHRAFMRSALQVATFDPRVAEALSGLRGKFIARIRAHLERAVARGECHDIDPAITSFLLVIMVEFTAYSWLSFGWQPDQGEFEVDAIVREASALWARAVYK